MSLSIFFPPTAVFTSLKDYSSLEEVKRAAVVRDSVLDVVKQSLLDLEAYLQRPVVHPPQSIEHLVGWIYDHELRHTIRKVYSLFFNRIPAWSFKEAQEMLAPGIVEYISGAKIPWDVFGRLMRREKLSHCEGEELKYWIEEVSEWGRLISPSLWLGLFEEAARRAFPNFPDKKGLKAAYLAWQLYKNGLVVLEAPDFNTTDLKSYAFDPVDGSVPFTVGEELDVCLPFEFPIAAYAIEGLPTVMAIAAPSPVILEMLPFNIMECTFGIPSLKMHFIESRRRFIVAERLLTSLEEVIWEEEEFDTKLDQDLLCELVATVSFMLKQPYTLALELDRIFLTCNGTIRVLSPLKKAHDFMSLYDLEQFVQKVVQKDQRRITHVLREAKFSETPTGRVYAALLRKKGLNISPRDIETEIQIQRARDQNLPTRLEDWAKELRTKAQRSVRMLKAQPAFAHVRADQMFQRVHEAIIQIQEELSFVSILPVDLVERIVARVSKNC